MIRNFRKNNTGFTIIEMMIAIALFLIVVLIGIGSLMNAISLNKKSQAERSVIDNLSFIMEDMSRNLRTGYDYHCGLTVSETPLSCVNGGGTIFFEAATGTVGNTGDQWGYKIESTDGGNTFNISKTTNGGFTWIQLNSSEINLDSASGFYVTGAEPPPEDLLQPFVTIKLNGTITTENNVVTPFSLETGVSQRSVDINLE